MPSVFAVGLGVLEKKIESVAFTDDDDGYKLMEKAHMVL